MDKLTQEQRHRCMSSIKGKNTKPEMVVRKFLFSRGFRYRLNHPRLPGHPDLVLRKYRTVIFVNGCFWHGHENCKYFRLPKTNIDFWSNKIKRNKERDKNGKIGVCCYIKRAEESVRYTHSVVFILHWISINYGMPHIGFRFKIGACCYTCVKRYQTSIRNRSMLLQS